MLIPNRTVWDVLANAVAYVLGLIAYALAIFTAGAVAGAVITVIVVAAFSFGKWLGTL